MYRYSDSLSDLGAFCSLRISSIIGLYFSQHILVGARATSEEEGEGWDTLVHVYSGLDVIYEKNGTSITGHFYANGLHVA